MATTKVCAAWARTALRTSAALFLCALGLTAAGRSSAQQPPDPRLGSWDEQKVSADFDSLLRVFEATRSGGIHMTVNAKLLPANRWYVDFSCDGNTYRTVTQDGKFTGFTYSCRRAGPRSFTFSATHEQAAAGVADAKMTTGDWVTATGTETVSDDGKRLETKAVLSFTDGHQRESRRQFVRHE